MTESPDRDSTLPLSTVIRRHCLRSLAAHSGHVRLAARSLGIGYVTLYRWLRLWDAGGEITHPHGQAGQAGQAGRADGDAGRTL